MIIPNWKNRDQKQVTRHLIALDALQDNHPTNLLSLPGSRFATEKVMLDKGVSFQRIIGVERDEEAYFQCRHTVEGLPTGVREKTQIHNSDMVTVLSEMLNDKTKLVNNYWLDFMGAVNHDTIHPIELIALSPTLKHAVDRFGKVRIQFVVKAHDRFKCQDEVLKHALPRMCNHYEHLSPQPPKGKDRVRLQSYYQQAFGLHYYFSELFKPRGFRVKNTRTIYYRDSKTPMLFYSMEVSYGGNFNLPEVSAPQEPVFLGMGTLSTPHTERWVEENTPKGVFTAKEPTLSNNPQPKPTPPQNTQEERGTVGKLGPRVYKVFKILAEEPRIQQDNLERLLLKKVPKPERDVWTAKRKGGTAIVNTIAWAKVFLRKGGYAHPKPKSGADDGIRLTQKGVRMVNHLPAYDDELIAQLKKGTI